ncbi:MAG TPA: hypothetical protein VNO34_01295 [Actinomycetota bacterium]|nr:hypothetical protein [Actinomycetota bacterium]
MSTVAPRVPPVADEEASPEARELFGAARELLGFVSNFTRTAAHAPELARWVVPLIAAVQRGGPDAELEPRVKELAILRTSSLNRCSF